MIDPPGQLHNERPFSWEGNYLVSKFEVLHVLKNRIIIAGSRALPNVQDGFLNAIGKYSMMQELNIF